MKLTKSPQELEQMTTGGKLLGNILSKLLAFAQVDVSLLAIEELASSEIAKSGGSPSFQTVKGYKWATCLCVNDVVVHGIPTNYKLRDGDILTIDVGLLYGGLHTDSAWTKLIKNPESGTGNKEYEEKEKFLKVGEDALWKAIEQATVGNRIGDISQIFQKTIEGAGYSIVKTLVGHGVGRELHEAPQVPGYVKGKIEDTQPLIEGMTLALEIIYAQGSGAVEYSTNDGWTIATKDGSLASVFEHTVAIGAAKPLVLTKPAQ